MSDGSKATADKPEAACPPPLSIVKLQVTYIDVDCM